MTGRHSFTTRLGSMALALAILSGGVRAEEYRPTYSLFGSPGLLEMPTAQSAPDGELGFSVSNYGNYLRNTLSFQISPRLSGSFRYARISGGVGTLAGENYYDRSFDLRYRLIDEGRYLPAVAVGLQDFIGTGLFSSEYLVATKTIASDFTVTAGLGWGRLGTRNGFTNPLGFIDDRFETRPPLDFGFGGRVQASRFFRGDAALFGGVEWRIRDNLTFKAEYSSDAYVNEVAAGRTAIDSPFNFGLTYRPRPGIDLGLSYLYGNEVGVNVTFALNPRNRRPPSGLEPAPPPVVVRAADARAAQTWDRVATPDSRVRDVLSQGLATEGQRLLSAEVGDRVVRIRYVNERYRTEAQAAGRIARVLSVILPPSIETFVLEPVQRGIPLSAVTIRRSDLEALENEPDATRLSYDRATIRPAGPNAGLVQAEAQPKRFSYGIGPYLEFGLFDPAAPVRGEIGIEVSARYEIAPNLVLSGAIRKAVVGNNDTVGTISPSTLQPVRRNASYYAVEGDPGIETLTLAWYGHPAPNLYSRVTGGYLESMFGGVSTELLWAPVNSRLAVGAEVNYVAQRSYDMGLGFGDDYNGDGTDENYSVLTGHLSAYYDLGKGYHTQVDVGRYLAGDYGATFRLDREFRNGWRVGAFFTITDVPFADFGEGSFDKGIRLTIPTDWFLGQPSRDSYSTVLRSLTRDGGARVDVDGRLYEIVRQGHGGDLADGWGRFWR